MNFKKWVKSIQTAGYNGVRTVYIRLAWAHQWCSVTPYLEYISKILSSNNNNSLWIHEKKPTWIWYTCGSPNIFRIPSSIITQDMKHSELSIYHKKIILFTLGIQGALLCTWKDMHYLLKTLLVLIYTYTTKLILIAMSYKSKKNAHL